jgi:histidinol-phosphate phosphatase family protein
MANSIREIPHYYLNIPGRSLYCFTPDGILGLPKSSGLERASMKDPLGRLALLDRDGVVIEKAPRLQYHKSPKTMRVLECSAEAIGLLNNAGIPVVFITNQPAVFKGQMSVMDLYEMTREIQSQIGDSIPDAHIDSVVFCPHAAPTEGDKVGLDQICTCRKPKTGMLELAMDLHGVDRTSGLERKNVFFFEDFASGIEAGVTAGIQSVYVATRHDEYDAMQREIKEKFPEVFARFQYPTLLEAVKGSILSAQDKA